MYPPDTYPKDIYPPDTYPPDTYPQDTYPLGHIPPRTYTPWDIYPLDTYPQDTYPLGHIPPGQIPPEHIRLAQTFETERKKLLFTLLYNWSFLNHTYPLFLPWPYDNYEENTKQNWKERTRFYSECCGDLTLPDRANIWQHYCTSFTDKCYSCKINTF